MIPRRQCAAATMVEKKKKKKKQKHGCTNQNSAAHSSLEQGCGARHHSFRSVSSSGSDKTGTCHRSRRAVPSRVRLARRASSIACRASRTPPPISRLVHCSAWALCSQQGRNRVLGATRRIYFTCRPSRTPSPSSRLVHCSQRRHKQNERNKQHQMHL